MNRFFTGVCAGVVAAFFSSCGTLPSANQPAGFGDLSLSVRISQPAALSKIAETTFDSLIILVTANDMTPIRSSFKLGTTDITASQTLTGITAGTNRLIEAWTVNKVGDTIHAVATTVKDFHPNEIVSVRMTLSPACGSIYIALTSFPSTVDSVYAGFVATDGRCWTRKEKKSTKISMSLDRVPYGVAGCLTVAGLGIKNDSIAVWHQPGFALTCTNTNLQASFVSVGKLAVDAVISKPAVTLVSGIMSAIDSVDKEVGGLIISEIMYAADDSEYVEIYNPQNDSVFYDTLLLEKDGVPRAYANIGIKSQGFFVIGRRILPWVNAAPGSSSALDLSSMGNWVALRAKDSTLLDMVAFAGSSNDLGWPSISGKKAILLDSLSSDPHYNNFGMHWVAALSQISGSSTMYGTPGKAGR